MNISVLGAGAWGTALAVAAAARHDTLLWARNATQAAEMRAAACNGRRLPGVALPPGLRIESDHTAAVRHADGGLCLVATPMSALRGQLALLGPDRPVLWLCKGLESASGALGHEVAAEVRPDAPGGVLSGPSFALEVARGQPTALVVASASAALRRTAVDALHGDVLRVYTSDDVVGVEVGGAVKNVMAIAAGLLDGLAARAVIGATASPGAGLNARAALVTRGLAEMTRLGVALGARAETFMGLSGLGDLVLTATGDLSRNRRLGLLLAGGMPLQPALAEVGHVVEGALAAPIVLARARSVGVDMPITEAVVHVLEGRLSAADAAASLMAREPRPES